MTNPAPEAILFCPVCGSDQTHSVLKVKDYSVSGEFFELFECPRCTLRVTKQAPPENLIGSYYQSENYISHSNTRKGIINTLYHQVRNRTLSVKHQLIEKMTGLKLGRHLDIGAGTGAFVQYMNRRNWRSQGVEPDATARERALAHHDTRLLPAQAFYDFPPESFDVISLWHVLEHVHDLYPYLHRIKEILNTRGMVFIAVPNYTSYDARRYGSAWAAYDVPRHLYHFSPASVKWMLREAGFQLKGTVPMWYDSFYISLLSEKYATGKSSLVKGFVTGVRSNINALSKKEECSSLIYVATKA